MSKVLLFSHSGFSDTNANGITMKNLLSAFSPEEKAEFYCDVQSPDFSAAHEYFRVTDIQMLKAFLGGKDQHVFRYSDKSFDDAATQKETVQPRKIPSWLKRKKYNFAIKWLREMLRGVSPWGHGALRKWIQEFSPDVVVYMVGESLYMDRLVLKTCRAYNIPLVLYNGEAYRIINLHERFGLERRYYRKIQKLYKKLNARASLVVYNCDMLQHDYESMYPRIGKMMVAHNAAECRATPYRPNEDVIITYFGNLGVGRDKTLVEVAHLLQEINPLLELHIYGNATSETVDRFSECSNIRYHGFLQAEQLRDVIDKSDILLNVESFDEIIAQKLRYAFSTKIAQCLCAQRCFISYAPEGTASSLYLASVLKDAVASNSDQLRSILSEVVSDPNKRVGMAKEAYLVGCKNHQMYTTASRCREEIEAVI